MNSQLILPSLNDAKYQQSFLKDPHSDLLILVGQHIIPLHINLLKKYSQYFEALYSKSSKEGAIVEIIAEPFDIETMELVFKRFYGYTLKLNIDRKLGEILKICEFFKFVDFYEQIVENIKKNFDEYEIFIILEIAEKIDSFDLKAMCNHHLKLQNFQQVNYNRFEFFSCSKHIFIQVIKKMLVFLRDSIQSSQVIQIINDYVSFNRIKNDADQIIQQVFKQTQTKRKNSEEIMALLGSDEIDSDLISSKDLSTEPSPKSFGDFSTFSQMEDNFNRFMGNNFLSAIEQKPEEIQASCNIYSETKN